MDGHTSQLECQLLHSQHAHLFQHNVHGRSVLPGAAMFEAAFAAAAVLLPEVLSARLVMQMATITAPLLLQPPPGAAAASLVTFVERHTGSVQLTSQGVTAARTAHLGASCAHLPTMAALPPHERRPLEFGTRNRCLKPSMVQTATDAGWQGEALGSLCQLPLDSAWGSYHCHPSVVDSATHLGAAYDVSQLSVPRVPVSLGSYAASPVQMQSSTHTRDLFTAATQASLKFDGSRISSFSVSPQLLLAELRSQPLGSKPPRTQLAGSPTQGSLLQMLAAVCCSYEFEWQAAAAAQEAGPSSAQRCAAQSPLLQLEAGGASCVAARGSMSQAALRNMAVAMSMLQSLKRGGMPPLIATLRTTMSQYGAILPALGGHCAMSVAAGAGTVAGLMKVAALEEPSQSLQLVYAHPAAQHVQAKRILAADVYGTAEAAGIVLQPLMQLSARQPGTALDAAQLQQRLPSCGLVISGGTGGLGMLSASHAAQGADSLLLLGRSGFIASSAWLPHHLLCGKACVTIFQADAASSADAAATAQKQGHAVTPAVCLIHAAGVLADGLLSLQRWTDARKVYAPKLAGLAAALPHLQAQPVQQVLLYSSVSATLGNRGQASYAAVNAALDASAEALVSMGQRSCSVQWGAWAGAGMASAHDGLLRRLEAAGEWAGLRVRPSGIGTCGGSSILNVTVIHSYLHSNCCVHLKLQTHKHLSLQMSTMCRPGRHPT